ncbi:hypothetical protein ACHHYP_03746 [Achlya hypogyna]|uniref:Uncharacterized protein n=1 Tax=Achlya hypogyna TaxID=1202772 RepID=A0A1V9Z2Z7_ACHHY|nr:hypothetical protein ACHHYP_03746 [Achlya hypogyna]
MSLVADYSDSDSDLDETPEVVTVAAPALVAVPAPCASPPVPLPSADDLFAGNIKPSSAAPPSFVRQTTLVPKPNKRSHDEVADPLPLVEKNVKVKVRSLVPPQLRNRRPNVSTEDVAAWNTLQTLKQQRKSDI